MVVNYVHTSYFHEELVIIFIYLILQRHINISTHFRGEKSHSAIVFC